MMEDVIDTLAGIAPGSALDTLRRRKPVTRDNAQASFDALFSPGETGTVSAADRAVLAAFVAGAHADGPGRAFYGARVPPGLREAVDQVTAAGSGAGPYGAYPEGVLSREDEPGPELVVPGDARSVLGGKLSAAIVHAHMLVFHPRDSAPERLRALEAAGWSADAIVTMSQLVAFLSFQLRAAHGLRALSATMGEPSP